MNAIFAPHKTISLAVHGSGRLTDAVAKGMWTLGGSTLLVVDQLESLNDDLELLLSVTNSVAERQRDKVQQWSRAHDTPWVLIQAELDRVLIGPLELPGIAGCYRCVESRRHMARPHRSAYARILAMEGGLADATSKCLTFTSQSAVGNVAVNYVKRQLLDQDVKPRTMLAIVDLHTLSTSLHVFQPDPLCDACGGLAPDTREASIIRLRSRPKVNRESLRTRPLSELAACLRNEYVDPEVGVVRELSVVVDGGLPLVSAPIGLRGPGDHVEPGIGRTLDYESAKLVAVLEALERHGGLQPGGKRTVVTGSFNELAQDAIDPRTLGMHRTEDYAEESFPFQRFDPATKVRWVWGYSLGRRRPVLVPEHTVYYRILDATHPERPFAFEISNGCAVGSSIEEAMLHGLLEVVERDAFLMTWYGRLPATELLLDSVRDIPTRLAIRRSCEGTPYAIRCWDITQEHGIPAVWAMAIGRTDEPDSPALICSSSAGLDLESAVHDAVLELGPMMRSLHERYRGQEAYAASLAADSRRVTSMDDHALLYAHPCARRRLDFLLSDPPSGPVPALAREGNTDLLLDLHDALGRLADAQLDVIVLDQTTPEHHACRLACVKVIVPGMLPMTFGHRFRRTNGLPRLTNRCRGGINPYPHPFP